MSLQTDSLTVTGPTALLGPTSLPKGAVTDGMIAPAAGVAASKLQQQYQPTYRQSKGSAAASDRQVIHLVYGAAGTLDAFWATLTQACAGAATITVDLYVNGASVLAAPISFASTDVAFTVKSATVTSQVLARDDVLEVVITATAGGGTLGQGICAQPRIREDAD